MTSACVEYSNALKLSVAIKGFQVDNIIQLTRSVRDCENDSIRSFSYHLLLTPDRKLQNVANPVEVTKSDLTAHSKSGQVTVKSTSSGDGKCAIDVLREGSLSVRVDASEMHEKIIGDEWFGGYSFSPDERRIVYVAGEIRNIMCDLCSYMRAILVPKREKPTTYFDSPPPPPDALPSKYNWKEDWGEKYTGVSSLGIFVLDTVTGAVQRVEGVGEDETVGQPVFTPDGRGVVYTAWSALPVRLGMIYCYQRPCCLKLAYLGTEGTVPPPITLTPHLRLARSAQFSPAADHSSWLVFLGSTVGMDTHNGTVELIRFDWSLFTASVGNTPSAAEHRSTCQACCRVLIDDSTTSAALLAGYTFPGLFCGGIRSCCFVSEHVLLLETQWRAVGAVLVVDLHTAGVRLLQFHEGSYYVSSAFDEPRRPANNHPIEYDARSSAGAVSSWLGPCPHSSSLVDALPGGEALLLTSTPCSAPVLAVLRASDLLSVMAHLKPAEASFAPVPTVLSSPFPPMAVSCASAALSAPNKAEEACRSFILYTACRGVDSVDDGPSYAPEDVIESVLLLPSQDRAVGAAPLVVCPHGGPHSAYSTTHMPHYSEFLCRQGGLAILLVNYRGSTVSSCVWRIALYGVFVQ